MSSASRGELTNTTHASPARAPRHDGQLIRSRPLHLRFALGPVHRTTPPNHGSDLTTPAPIGMAVLLAGHTGHSGARCQRHVNTDPLWPGRQGVKIQRPLTLATREPGRPGALMTCRVIRSGGLSPHVFGRSRAALRRKCSSGVLVAGRDYPRVRERHRPRRYRTTTAQVIRRRSRTHGRRSHEQGVDGSSLKSHDSAQAGHEGQTPRQEPGIPEPGVPHECVPISILARLDDAGLHEKSDGRQQPAVARQHDGGNPAQRSGARAGAHVGRRSRRR